MSSETSGCCLIIKGFNDNGCGNEVKYYLIVDSVPILKTLPFDVCSDNSDMQIRVDILDENSNVICVKEYDFSPQLLGCSCCDEILPVIIQDTSHTGSGCKFLLSKISKSERCDFDSTITVEYGYFDSEGLVYENNFNFTDFDDWVYYLDNCERKRLSFKFMKGAELVCEKEVEIFCQNCEDLDVQFENTQTDSIYMGGEKIYFPLCCVEVIYGGSESENCLYTGVFGTELINLPNILGTERDTFRICTPSINPIFNLIGKLEGYGETYVNGTFDIFNSKGELVCDYNFYRDCPPVIVQKMINDKSFIKEENIIIENNKFEIEFNSTNKLEYFIIDITGRIVERKIYLESNLTHIDIDLTNLINGVYFINIISDSGSIVQTFNIVR